MIGAVERSCFWLSGYVTCSVMWPVLLCDLYFYVTCTVMLPVLYVTFIFMWPVLLCDLHGHVTCPILWFYHHTFSFQSMHFLCMTVTYLHNNIVLWIFRSIKRCSTNVGFFLFQEVKLWTAWAPGRIVRRDSVLDLVVVFILWGAESEASLNHQFILKIDGFLQFPFFLFSFLVCFKYFLSFV